jgi:ESCRT-I complex subunit VPS28
MTMTLSLDEEVRLYTTNTEREKYESLATLYGIIVSLDYLERAYVRDAVPASEYAPKCVQLLGRYAPCFRASGRNPNATLNGVATRLCGV